MPDNDLPAKRNIALFLDGTWNTLWDNTNVWRLKSLCQQNNEQLVYYSKGVGTQKGWQNWWEYLIGGGIGYGIDQEIIDAYEWLVEHYREGDHLYIFGFSRGAYTARSLSGLISKCGLLRAGSPLSVNQLFDRYKTKGARTIRALKDLEEKGQKNTFSTEDNWMLKYCTAPAIWFLGVWDTVGALGIPLGDVPSISTDSYKFLETDLRINNDRAYHALAIDEHREKFAPTLFTRSKNSTQPPRPLNQVEQRWFVGAHANVGGGYENDLLAQPALMWLMEKAKEHGLAFADTVSIDGDLYKAPITDSYAAFLWGIYKFLPFTHRYYREIDGRPIVSNPQEESENINETIDVSVFHRWRTDSSYRPPNLKTWADKHRVDIDGLTTSVFANNPAVAVSDSPVPGGQVVKIASK